MKKVKRNFILGSSSVQRLQVLNSLGFFPSEVLPADILEVFTDSEVPFRVASRLAAEKNYAIVELVKKRSIDEGLLTVILSADTVVSVGRRIIDKCLTDEEVGSAMQLLSGRGHRVFTAVTVSTLDWQGEVVKINHKISETRIKFKRLTEEEISFLVSSKQGIGKSGGYTISGIAESFMIRVVGSCSGVVGLPSYETRMLLMNHGIVSKPLSE